jgi:hypothetical protein
MTQAPVCDYDVETATEPIVRRSQPRCRLIAPIALSVGATVIAYTSAPGSPNLDVLAAAQQRYAEHGTAPAVLVNVPSAVPAGDYAATLRELRRRSGFTWNEVARALGVSRRAVHHWSAGKRPAEGHALRLQEFSRLIAQYESATPDWTRGALLAPGRDGFSALSRFADVSGPSRVTPLSTLRPADFFEGDELSSASVRRPTRPSSLAPRPLRDTSGTD